MTIPEIGKYPAILNSSVNYHFFYILCSASNLDKVDFFFVNIKWLNHFWRNMLQKVRSSELLFFLTLTKCSYGK